MAEPSTDRVRLTLAQLNPIVGDVAGNMELARAALGKAREQGADLLVFPELFIAGYPPEDLVLRPAFIETCRAAVETLAADTRDGPAILIGAPWIDTGRLHNSILLLDGGAIAAVRHKVDLPNYGVFDEKRVFAPGRLPEPVQFRGVLLGLPICEDLWARGIVDHLGARRVDLVIAINGSPYWREKEVERLAVARAGAAAANAPLLYLNMVGGQDELVFDGASLGVAANGELVFRLGQFEPEIAALTIARAGGSWAIANPPASTHSLPGPAADWAACVLGLRDYVQKNRFPGVVLGLSGGIDSAVVAAMATDALGPGRVHTIMLPYRFTAGQSLSDAEACAKALGARYDVVPIAEPVEALERSLAGLFDGLARDVTEENLQARARGVILMAVSNKLGSLLVTTGNKSEVSVGYSTLYGDMNGGFNPIKDLFKTEVYRLARWRNSNHLPMLKGPRGEVIPEAIIARPPTAELHENQRDQDSLPPYDVLDSILVELVEHDRSVVEVIAKGFDPDLVRRIEHLVHLSEYKRRQAAPGVKISGRNFGRDRRYPITNRFREG